MKDVLVKRKSFEFALEIIQVYRQCAGQREFVLSKQLLRSGTSIGANIEEAYAAQSRPDFLSKMSIASKEARETHYWLRLLDASRLVDLDFSSALRHADELVRMLTALVKSTAQPPNSELKTKNLKLP